MNYLPLIFPIVFSDDDFKTLDTFKDVLTDLITELNEISVCNPKMLGLGFYNVLQDLKEVIRYRNAKGYKWNSYLLRLILVKLEYVNEVLKDECAINARAANKVVIIWSDILLEMLCHKFVNWLNDRE